MVAVVLLLLPCVGNKKHQVKDRPCEWRILVTYVYDLIWWWYVSLAFLLACPKRAHHKLPLTIAMGMGNTWTHQKKQKTKHNIHWPFLFPFFAYSFVPLNNFHLIIDRLITFFSNTSVSPSLLPYQQKEVVCGSVPLSRAPPPLPVLIYCSSHLLAHKPSLAITIFK